MSAKNNLLPYDVPEDDVITPRDAQIAIKKFFGDELSPEDLSHIEFRQDQGRANARPETRQQLDSLPPDHPDQAHITTLPRPERTSLGVIQQNDASLLKNLKNSSELSSSQYLATEKSLEKIGETPENSLESSGNSQPSQSRTRVHLHELPPNEQQFIADLLEECTLEAAVRTLALPPPHGLNIKTCIASLHRFGAKISSEQTAENQALALQLIEKALTQMPVGSSPGQLASHLIQLRLVNAAIDPQRTLSAICGLVPFLNQLRAMDMKEKLIMPPP